MSTSIIQNTDWTLQFISKNHYMRSEGPGHQTHLMPGTLTVTLEVIPNPRLCQRRPDDVHRQAHASKRPQILSSHIPMMCSLFLPLHGGIQFHCGIWMLHSYFWTPFASNAMSGYRLPMPA